MRRLGVDLDLLEVELLLEVLWLLVLLLVGLHRASRHGTDLAGSRIDEEHLLLDPDFRTRPSIDPRADGV